MGGGGILPLLLALPRTTTSHEWLLPPHTIRLRTTFSITKNKLLKNWLPWAMHVLEFNVTLYQFGLAPTR